MLFNSDQIILPLLAGGTIFSSYNPIITTTSGRYAGYLNESTGIEIFKGIRYAEPPLGNLRFAPPEVVHTVPVEIQDATIFGNACSQQDLSQAAFTILFGNPSLNAGIGEDCLFMNIYRPEGAVPGEDLPILVFVHGGAYSIGAGSQFDGTRLVKRSVSNGAPIIFISINYRLYVTGFLSSSTIPVENLNAGLSDQSFAFRFIHENARALGGDPDRITVWGQSTGGASIALHNLFSSTPPLYRAAIQESSSASLISTPFVSQYDAPGGPFTLLLKHTGCPRGNGALACLRNIPIERLLDIAFEVDRLIPQSVALQQSTAWVPSVGPEGSMITELPSERIARNLSDTVPLIVGTNQDEGSLFGVPYVNTARNPEVDDMIFAEFIQNRTIGYTVGDSTIEEILSLYPEGPQSPITNSSLFTRLEALGSDYGFLAPRRHFTDHLPADQKLWMYLFGEALSGMPPYLGAFHGSELSFLGIVDRPLLTAEAEAVSDQFMDLYLNFTVNLDPGSSWPSFTKENRKLLQIKSNSFTAVPDKLRLEYSTFFSRPDVYYQFRR